MTDLARPAAGEHADYYARYVALVPDGDICEMLRAQLGDTVDLLDGLDEAVETTPYAPGKWSLRESVGHLVDTERLFVFRALAMAREDGVDLPGMDQDAWAANSNARERPLSDLCAEWIALRRSTVHFFATLPAGAGGRTGFASGYEFSVRSFAWIIAGHELWHRQLFEEHYLGGVDG